MSRRNSVKYDTKLLCAVLCLVALGLVMVFSASQVIAREHFSSPYFFMQNHAVRVGLGLIGMLVFARLPYTMYRRFSVWVLAAAVILLASIFIWGKGVRGANRWLSLFTFTIQPVEVAKFSLVVFIAAWISDGAERIRDLRTGFLPLLGVAALMAVLVGLQPNISNAVLIMLLSLTVLFVGGCRLRHLLLFGSTTVAAALPILYGMEHVRERFMVVLGLSNDPQGLGYHVNQSLIALGSGFLFGCGPGRGLQKYSFLPDAHTDFIYSIIGEELGILGTTAVLVLFAYIFRRTIRIAGRAPDAFGFLLASGIGITLFGTALINMAMTTGLLPTAGLPLPFVSYGGSSLVTSMSAVGILLNISSRGRERPSRRAVGRGTAQRSYARRAARKDVKGG